MPSYGQTVTLQYVAWDAVNADGKTGDVANHTLKWVKDGTAATPTNSAAEVDATNAPGIYKLVMTATEAQCQVGTICGKSSTSGIVILPLTVTFENLPTAVPNASGGLPTFGTGSGQINPSSGGVDLQTIKTQAITCAAGVTFPTSLASPTNITAGTIATVTNLTNLPAITTDWLTGTGTAASAVTKIQAGLATPTNITAGTVTTATNLTNLPAITANWLTGTGVDATAVTKVQSGLASPTNITAGTITTVTTVTNAVTAGTVSDKTGYSLNLTQAIPTSNTDQTVGDALNAARADGFGKWVLSGTSLTIYAGDGTTSVRTFTLDSATAPTQRV